MDKPIQSVSYDQQQIINDILHLHNGGEGIDVDVTYSKGVFYKDGVVKEPIHKFELTPQTDDTIQASSDNIPLEDSSVKCIEARTDVRSVFTFKTKEILDRFRNDFKNELEIVKPLL